MREVFLKTKDGVAVREFSSCRLATSLKIIPSCHITDFPHCKKKHLTSWPTMKKGSATVPVLSKYQRRTVKANVIQISNTFQESSWCVKNIFSKADMICSEFDVASGAIKFLILKLDLTLSKK